MGRSPTRRPSASLDGTRCAVTIGAIVALGAAIPELAVSDDPLVEWSTNALGRRSTRRLSSWCLVGQTFRKMVADALSSGAVARFHAAIALRPVARQLRRGGESGTDCGRKCGARRNLGRASPAKRSTVETIGGGGLADRDDGWRSERWSGPGECVSRGVRPGDGRLLDELGDRADRRRGLVERRVHRPRRHRSR